MTAVFAAPAGLVPALDVDTFDDMLRVVEKTSGVAGVVGYKLGLTGVLPMGLPHAIQSIRRVTDLPIVYDHQKAGPDMPDMASKFARLCRQGGADALILFPVAGPHAVAEFVGETIRQGMLPIVGGHIPVPDYCVSGGGFLADDVLDRIIGSAIPTGAKSFVLPANDPEAVRRHVATICSQVGDSRIFLTGFGSLGGDISTAFGAARLAPRRYAIVGRAVSTSADPAEAARRMVGEIMRAI